MGLFSKTPIPHAIIQSLNASSPLFLFRGTPELILNHEHVLVLVLVIVTFLFLFRLQSHRLFYLVRK